MPRVRQTEPSALPAMLTNLAVVPLDRGFAYQREASMWAVTWRGREALVRRLEPEAQFPSEEGVVLAARAWIHKHLSTLNALGAPVPEPLPVFDGKSVVATEGAVWEALSWLAGEAIAWSDAPTMKQVGAFLAHFHCVAEELETEDQRPGALPLGRVTETITSAPWTELTDDRFASDRVIRLAEDFAKDLNLREIDTRPRVIVHGDPTTMNVLADGRPIRPAGLIDFGSSYLEGDVAADIGFGLYISGRPSREANTIDPARVAALVSGYVGVRPLNRHTLRAIPVFILGRGLQIVAKRARAGMARLDSLERLEWIASHLPLLKEASSDLLA